MERSLPVPFLLVALAFSGCHGDHQQTFTGPTFVTDLSADAPKFYDLLSVQIVNLNGSFALALRFANISAGGNHPLYNATVDVDRNEGGSLTLFAAVVADAAEPPPHLRGDAGIVEAGGGEAWEACYATRLGEPATVYHDLVNNRTGLLGGGVVTRVSVEVTNPEGTVMDTGLGEGAFALAGGSNPYVPQGAANPDAYCPLIYDPSSPVHPGTS